jgi:CBS domain-containing protein
VTAQAEILVAARLMREAGVDALPVVDGGRVVGLLTDDDVVDAMVDAAGGRGLSRTPRRPPHSGRGPGRAAG